LAEELSGDEADCLASPVKITCIWFEYFIDIYDLVLIMNEWMNETFI
jgi:hypothetical protein